MKANTQKNCFNQRSGMKYGIRILASGVVFLTADWFVIGAGLRAGIQAVCLLMLLPLYLLIHIFPSFYNRRIPEPALRNSADGCELLEIFGISTAASVVWNVAGWCGALSLPAFAEAPGKWSLSILFTVLMEGLVFWNGMIRIYITSVQLGMKWRIIGALCGMIPVANLVVLLILVRKVRKEIQVECDKIARNEQRKEEQVCATRYPILLVHGVFFRDSKNFNYWGRIPKELEENGARVYYGNHGSAASVEDSAKELDRRIRQIVGETGCGKVNIIAHSKGGLDCRYAMAKLGTAPYIASLSTINTPHRGCKFADYLLSKIPEGSQRRIAGAYNGTLRKLGDENPDFMAAVTDLTGSACEARNRALEGLEDYQKDVFCQSVGARLNQPSGGRFPLNFSYSLVRHFDGANDGLVGVESFAWGEKYQFVSSDGRRGISHGDMIDLNRENFDDFDVREFYVEMVQELKNRGL